MKKGKNLLFGKLFKFASAVPSEHKEKKMGRFSYSSSGTSGSVASLQLNCNNKKFVTNSAPKTIKNVVMMMVFYIEKMREVRSGCVNSKIFL